MPVETIMSTCELSFAGGVF